MMEKAFFVFRPRTVADLLIGNPDGRMMEYRIVKIICLSKIDYENFTTDLLADRQFIEDNAALCTATGDCLLVKTRGTDAELLVVPWKGCFVRYAALRPAVQLLD